VGSPKQIAIIGGGIGGLATAFFLGAEKDIEVTLFEREPRHNAHSSGRSAEILRTAIDDPVTEELALTTAAALSDPSSMGLQAGAELLDRRGLFVVTSTEQNAPWAERHLRAGAARESSLEELKEAAPHFTPQGRRVLHLASGGQIRGDRLLASLARGAIRRGVHVHRSTGDAVPRILGGRVTGVEVAGRLVPCDALVVAAGAWSGPMSEALGAPLPLRTTRRHMWVTAPVSRTTRKAPIVWDDASGFYVRPEVHSDGSVAWAFSATDLDERLAAANAEERRAAYVIDEGARAAAVTAAGERLVAAPLAGLSGWRGFRDLSPDDRPMIGQDPRIEGLHWCAGLGGHGMTTSLAVGRVSADAVMQRPGRLVDACGVGRFLGVEAQAL
jgi:sarcosine oxidase subunit beta